MKKIIKLLLKSILRVIILLVLILGYFYLFHTYKYNSTEQLDFDSDKIVNVKDYDIDGDGIDNLSDTDADNDGISNIDDIINNAREMEWTVYEYLKGKYDNLGGKMGFIVCIDVPRIAYEKAGIYFEQLLRDDFKKHPENYKTANGNNPTTKFFFRRVRNIYDYCKGNNKLIRNCKSPKKGDLVFYGRWHIALVTAVNSDGTYDEIEAAPWTFFTLEHKNKKWIQIDVGRILNEK